MVSALFESLKANDPYELLISQILQIESQPRRDLELKRSTQERMKKALDDLDSNVSALHTLLTSFTDTLSNPFGARTATLPDTTSFTVTASDDAPPGSHTLQVHRLASTDTRLSKQFTSSGTSLRSFFDTYGAQTFEISVASPTDADPNNRVAISVMVNPTGTTDDDILDEIAAAIKTAMDDAVDSGLIKSTEAGSASVVKETSDTSRLTLRSGQTGYANRLEFTDSADGLLTLLEVNKNEVASGTGGGQVTRVGTGETDSDLNAKFTLDGLTLYRSTNQVTDALDGLTLTLKQAGDPVDFSVGSDTEGIKGQIKDFIAKYNAVLNLINSKTQVDGDLDIRADFAGDSLLTGLRFGMRSEIARQVSGQPAGAPTLLAQIGIETNEDGTLVLKDEEKLTKALEENPEAVQNLFAGSDGVATRLKTRLDAYLGADGLIENRIDSIEQRIFRLDGQIKDFDERLALREQQLREQFAKLQEAIALFQGQQQFLGGLFG
ncbi:MAG: flagellar hook-associated protein 2 [Rhodothermaceae bacterium]|nr:MAG: flagellar hook-associated protein 2 [Rhodothermaceae bacterium]